MDIRLAISRCEDYTEKVAYKTKKVLPTVARLLLVSTFIEDGFRLLLETHLHANHFSETWGLNYHFSYFLCLIMILNLLCGSLFVMLRFKVNESSVILAVTIFCQIILYELYTTYHILCRNISILAALLLLIAENMLRKPKRIDQLPRDENDFEITSVMLCACRLFLNLMLVSMVHFDMSYKRLLLCFISYGMMISVWCGYKTRMMSLLLAGWLFAYNIVGNDFWNKDAHLQIVRYDFFQTLSAIGGLLLLIHTGPGEFSVDEFKKKW